MIKNILFTTLIALPYMASADAVNAGTDAASAGALVPIDKCTSANADRCEVFPVHQEIVLKDAAKDVSLGTVYLTSTPRESSSHAGLNVEIEATIKCQGQKEKRTLIKKTSVCGFPEARAEVDAEAYVFKLVHDPTLNLTEDNRNIILRFNKTGTSASGYCGAEDRMVIANPCLPSTSQPTVTPTTKN